MIDPGIYSRFFAFGCSFTNYAWPTWADIVARSMPNAEYHNLGFPGIGNMGIAARISEATERFSIGKGDLVMVMWTTTCREDRWVNGRWMMTGNIYTQSDYDEEFVERYADPFGYLIRDLGMMNLVDSHLRASGADHVMMPSVPATWQQDANDDRVTRLMDIYSGVLSGMEPNMLDLEMGGNFVLSHSYQHPGMPQLYHDHHPLPSRYLGYLLKIGVMLSADSIRYAKESDGLIASTRRESDLVKIFDFSGRNSDISSMF